MENNEEHGEVGEIEGKARKKGKAPRLLTDKHRAVLLLLEQGKSRQEILEAGYGKGIVDRMIRYYKLQRRKESLSVSPSAKSNVIIRPRVVELVQVGGLFIEPADWRINQEGVYLILNTHKKAREEFGYEGGVGDFICDCVQAMRKIMGVEYMGFDYLKEDDNGAGLATKEGEDSGGGFLEEGGEEIAGDQLGEPQES